MKRQLFRLVKWFSFFFSFPYVSYLSPVHILSPTLSLTLLIFFFLFFNICFSRSFLVLFFYRCLACSLGHCKCFVKPSIFLINTLKDWGAWADLFARVVLNLSLSWNLSLKVLVCALVMEHKSWCINGLACKFMVLPFPACQWHYTTLLHLGFFGFCLLFFSLSKTKRISNQKEFQIESQDLTWRNMDFMDGPLSG